MLQAETSEKGTISGDGIADLRRDVVQTFPYSRDLAEIPGFLLRPWFRTLPQVVALPRNTVEVAEAVALAQRERLAVTPRAGGSSAYFNSVPARGGMIVDMNRINHLEEVDRREQTVMVGAGMTWLDLEQELAPLGLTTRSYPSSAPVATVGGWFASGGLGLGTMRFGPFPTQVTEAEVVLGDGTVRWLNAQSNPPLSWLAGSEGTLGFITRLRLRVRPLSGVEEHWLVACATAQSLQKLAGALAGSHPLPFSLHFQDPAHVAALKRLGFLPPTVPDAYLLQIDTMEDPAFLGAAVARLSREDKTAVLDPALAWEEWDNRFNSLRLKRLAPTIVGAEVLLPLESLGEYLDGLGAIARVVQGRLYTYGHVVTPTMGTIMTLIATDADAVFFYLQDLALIYRIQRLGLSLGGRPYGVGLWNTPYQPWVLSRREREELRERKRRLDPDDRLNPGKLYAGRAYLRPWLFRPAMTLMGLLPRGGGGRGN